MRKIRLRTKFLLSLLTVTAGLTTATLLLASYTVQKQIRSAIRDELRSSLSAYRGFDEQQEAALARSARLLADLPNLRALMTTQDAATVQDGSSHFWDMSGSDLMILASRSGKILAIQSKLHGLSANVAEDLVQRLIESSEERLWWSGGGRLYEVCVQPIYFGPPPDAAEIGFLVLGREINEKTARDFSQISGTEVAFTYGAASMAGTLTQAAAEELSAQQSDSGLSPADTPKEVQLGKERYLAATIVLPPHTEPPVSLSILKSLDKATRFLQVLNHLLLTLGVVSVFAGSALVFLISDTFSRPLATLVSGVRALERGDFSYPLEPGDGDEVAEVTSAFDRMRSSLQETQKEQKELEGRLRQAHKMEAIGRLAGGVAHDFNNLLTVIKGHCDLLSERAPDSSGRHSLEQIQKAAGRAVSMTRQLLAFSRMQVLEPRVLDLNAILADMGKMVPRLIGEDIEYSFLPGPNLSPVKADRGQIEQVILNLVVNARDAMPDGGALTLRTMNATLDAARAAERPPMPEGDYVFLSVADTGHGMDEKTRVHIFEPFFTTKEPGKGTGLGLATVYGVVKQSGGFIWVESSPGKGAQFEIYLPQCHEKPDATPAATPARGRQSGSETILVVEDEAGVRDLACQFLKQAGYSVLEACHGVEALELAARHSGLIDLLLSDIVMPKMSGVELAAHLRAIRPDLKVILMSGYSEYSGRQAASIPSDIRVLQKPFSMPLLGEAIREALATNRNPAESFQVPG